MTHPQRPAFVHPGPGRGAGLLHTVLVGGWLLVLALLACRPAVAQSTLPDPPGRVARLSELSGSAWAYRPDDGDWTEAVRNLPLTTGDRLATDPNGRAELQIGSTTLRLDGGSELEVVALDDSRIALQLHAGALAARVRNAAEAGQVDVLTDDGRFLVLRAGSYRFDRGTRSSFVLVESGEVRYERAGSALNVGTGQRGEFWVDANGAAQYALLAPVADAFTAWNAERDRGFEVAGVATRYVSPEMTGVQELDRYGTWEQTPDYGAVWFPSAVAADWAPYSAGRWSWVRPWGWTWVDDAPWGFAPFHYGRWVNVRNRWCWTPGVRQPRPVWAPALVGWVGGGAPAGGPRGAGGPAVGWFPLAPREVYMPGYASTPRYIRSINQTNVNNPALVNAAINDPRSARDFQNRRFPNAVTIVPATVVTERRPVGPAASQFRDAPWARDFAQRGGPGVVVSTAPPFAPRDPASYGDARRPPRPPPGFEDRRGERRDRFADRDGPRPSIQAPGGAADPRLSQPGGDRFRNGYPDRAGPPGEGRRGPGDGRDTFGPQRGTPNAAQPQVPPIAPVVPQSPAPIAPMAPQPGLVSPPGAGGGFPQRQPPGGFPQRGPLTNGPDRPSPMPVQPRPIVPNDENRGPMLNVPANRPPREPVQPPQPRPVVPNDENRGPMLNTPANRLVDPQQPSPQMRAQPVYRGEERRNGEGFTPPVARPEIAPVRPSLPPPAAPPPTQPVAPMQPQRPPEAQSPRLAPPRGPEPMAPRPSESPRAVAPERRTDPGAAR